jgi:trans-AT polyketide synthase, acyltransferase and oxidoreductase domains
MEQLRKMYQCQKLEIQQGTQLLSFQGEGGSLVDRIATIGISPLVEQLMKAKWIQCSDKKSVLRLSKKGNQVHMVSQWADGTEHLSVFDFPTELHIDDDIPMVINSEPKSPSILPVVDISPVSHSLLDVPSHNLWVKDGNLYSEECSMGNLIPALGVDELGKEFCDAHGVCSPYVAGAMAGGIASVELVSAMSTANKLAFFGAGGLQVETIETALQRLSKLPGIFGCNLLHNPIEPGVEDKTVDLYLKYEVRYISASAYVRLSPALVRYRLQGIHFRDGRVFCQNRIFAKVSHPSVAERFMSPPPEKIVQQLLKDGKIDAQQAKYAASIPMAEDITVEADSGGHTDSRPLSVIVPFMKNVRNMICDKYKYDCAIRIGAAGGLGDPTSIYAAFGLGADYVLLGSIHQSTVEAGTSHIVKQMLAEASITDCAMGAAPDMFEQGAHVQVLSKGTLYAARANKLREMYRRYESIESIPEKEITKLERTIFKHSIQEVWNETRKYWTVQDPRQVQKALQKPKHKMALIFRWYLGLSSRWARTGTVDRKRDFQIWCGPSMGLFNQWAVGTEFADVNSRRIVDISEKLMNDVLIQKRRALAKLYGVIQ